MSYLRSATEVALLTALGLLAAGTRAGASAPSGPDSKGAQASPATVEVINGTTREIKTFHGPETTSPSRPSRGTVKGTSVEVINGTNERTVVLQPASNPAKAMPVRRTRRRYRRGRKSAVHTAPVTTEILNGTVRSTAVFHSQPTQTPAPARSRNVVVVDVASSGSQNPAGAREPVVIGIASSESGTTGGTQKPVVVRVASSGFESDAGLKEPVVLGIESSGVKHKGSKAMPVAIGVSPNPPKRPPYRRATPSP